MNVILVMLGGFFGAISRYLLGEWITTANGFPVGTLTVNLVGCLALGWFLSFAASSKKVNSQMVLITGTGFLGSFTTFSTFSVETIHLLDLGLFISALLYVLISVTVGLFLAYVGYKLAQVRKQGDVA